MNPMEPERCWEAVVARDARWDGRFVYAVSSTGVFCRPSCAARRPRRDRVTFFAPPVAAERAGYRPCLRCRPTGDAAPRPGEELVRRACRILDAASGERVTLTELGRRVAAGPHRVQRAFRRVLGITPRQYAEARRVVRLKAGLRGGNGVAGALYAAGYGSSSRLYERADRMLGMTPATYGRGGRDMVIRYDVAASPLGRLLVAATERGVCAVKLGEDDGTLEKDLSREFPHADLRRDDRVVLPHVRAVLAFLADAAAPLDLPLDVRATAFQWRVWSALRAIPPGETRSYGDVARAVGRPAATRAVARACATNPVALVVPCHRVVRAGGSPGGYRWGEDRKRSLLERERSAATPRGGGHRGR